MSHFIMLCGLPGTGKSTYIKLLNQQLRGYDKRDATVISSDNILELIGNEYGLIYNDIFGDISYSFAERMMYKVAEKVFEREDRTIVWDQTNLTVKSRAKKLAMVPEHYWKEAIIFNPPLDHHDRLRKRALTEGKLIPWDVLASMNSRFVKPTHAEGFDSVIEMTM